MGQSHADQGPERAGSRGDRITADRIAAERYRERAARLTQRWGNAKPHDTSRMTEHEARALTASLRETDEALAALTDAWPRRPPRTCVGVLDRQAVRSVSGRRHACHRGSLADIDAGKGWAPCRTATGKLRKDLRPEELARTREGPHRPEMGEQAQGR
ncbi:MULTISPECIES: hypothetical protein [unclassified Streptomyces]|uniref:hypothetical protein n=1 Tax=unclassified Streptomyces TaxID=2593676 RepID=UPI002366DAA1|nr:MULTISPECIES: hypothetical protein [unclassified Streptomyces]MDF3140043.1 hypothetical protein [Streptomyces sp. T21Q-yed]WDF43667.1 hypothetical protein PBV52_46265 [Streptomyces sp. T12]